MWRGEQWRGRGGKKAEKEAEEEEEERSNIIQRPRTISNRQLPPPLLLGHPRVLYQPAVEPPSRAHGLGRRFSACLFPFLPHPFGPYSLFFPPGRWRLFPVCPILFGTCLSCRVAIAP